jgi:hypothetical protein
MKTRVEKLGPGSWARTNEDDDASGKDHIDDLVYRKKNLDLDSPE